MLSPRGEELLSYLIGLAPVGRPVKLVHEHVWADLGIKRTHMLMLVQELITKDVVTRCAPSVYRVANRTILDFKRAKVRKKAQQPATKKPRLFAHIERRDEDYSPVWPPKFDRRSLTAFICGDPLPERSALARRA